jgi:hypothetical protein
MSSSLKDLHNDMNFEVPNERNVQSDSGLSSVASSVCIKSHRPAVDVRGTLKSAQPAPPNTADKKRFSYARRSTSQESNTSQQTSSSVTASIDFFRLPPILTPLMTEEYFGSEASENAVEFSELKRCDSLSSVEPNVDSSLSSLPSDSSSSSGNNNVSSSSSEHSDLESSEELASAQEAVRGNTKSRNVKSATPCCKIVPRRAQTRPATGRVQQKQSVHQGRVREQGMYT